MLNNKRPGRRVSRRGVIAGSIGTAVAAGAGLLPAQCHGKIYPGVTVNGIDVAGMTVEDGEKALREGLARFEAEAVTYRFGDRSWTASLADLGMAVDYRSVLDSAMGSVRNGGVLDRYRSLISEDYRHEVALFLREDGAGLDRYLEALADEIAVEPKDARVYRSGLEIKVLPQQAGRRMNLAHVREETTRLVRKGAPAIIDLAVESVPPNVTSDDLAGQKEAAARLISEPVVFTHGDLEYVFDTKQLASALTITRDNKVSLESSLLDDRIASIEKDVAVAPKNVTLAWDGGPYVVENDVPGERVDRDTFKDRLLAVAASDVRVEPLPVVEVKAAARADNLAELGLDGHIATGSSSFAGSSYERAANVSVSAHNINYKLIAPGEEFSFNDLLGPITEDYGYIAGSIIQGDFAETDIGGGVCQVSTTVFRAAQNAGFQFSEWNPHSWRLAFYEADGSSPGLDAAIYQPNSEWEYELDLRFTNPLDSWLLLMMVVDGDWVSAHFYGTHPGWTVEVFPARISDPKRIPEPVEKVNPELPPGERRLVGQAQPGYTVWVRRKVTGADGSIIADGDFVSDYVSQPEAWEVGPS